MSVATRGIVAAQDTAMVGAQKGLAILALIVAIGGALTGAIAGPGYQRGWYPLQIAFSLVTWGTYFAAGATIMALIAAALPPWRASHFWRSVAVAAILIGGTVSGIGWNADRAARAAPAINDITTDSENPPRFKDILPLRPRAIPAEYPGPDTARVQKSAYPDIQPIRLPGVPQEQAFAAALNAAKVMGWTIVANVPGEGRIEAVAETFWFGLKDDIVIRVGGEGPASRIDIRSKSRIGRSDRGINAARIREFIRRVQK